MKAKKSYSIALAFALAFAAPAIAVENGGNDYSISETGRAYNIKTGVIMDLRMVDLRENPQSGWSYTPRNVDASDACAGIGTLVGGVVGNRIGGGNGRILATIVLAGVSGVGGKRACTVGPQQALEISIKLDAGAMIAVVQAIDADIRVGDRVRLVEGQKTRVSRIPY